MNRNRSKTLEYWKQIELPNKPTLIPKEYNNLFNFAKGIYRYKMSGYIDRVIRDNDAQHIYRVTEFGHRISPVLGRILLIHDFPEVICILRKGNNRDVTAVQKLSNPLLAESIETNEYKVAVEIFSADDLELYKRLEKGKRAIKETPSVVIDGLGVLAKVIDTTDGNMCFHYYISSWFGSLTDQSLVNSWSIPSLEYTFNYYKKTREAVKKLTFDEDKYKDMTLKRLDDHLKFVSRCWLGVPDDNKPETIKQKISEV